MSVQVAAPDIKMNVSKEPPLQIDDNQANPTNDDEQMLEEFVPKR